MSRTLPSLILAGVLAALATLAQPAAAADIEAIRKLAQERLSHSSEEGGSVVIKSIRATPYLGLYELVTEDRRLVYTDESVSYLFAGRIYDLKSFKDLTSERMEEISAIKFDALPLDLAIKSVKGNGKRRLVVFSDSDCPFCRKLETELSKVTDVTVYTFLFPIEQLHPNAPDHSRRIWCAPDRLKAWNDYWNHNAIPAARDCDVSALEQIQKLGRDNGIQATPTLVFGDGHVIPGALPVAQLEKNLGPR